MTTKCKRINDGLKLRQTSTFELYDEEGFNLIRTVDEEAVEAVLGFLEWAEEAGHLECGVFNALDRFFHDEGNV